MSTAYKKLGKVLSEKGMLNEEGFRRASELSRKEDVRFGEACVRLNLMSELDLAITLAEQYGLRFVHLDTLPLDDAAMDVLPLEALRAARAVPVKDGERVLVVTSDPADITAIDDLERLLRDAGMKTSGRAVTTVGELEAVINRGRGAGKLLSEMQGGLTEKKTAGSAEESVEALTLERISQDSSPVIKLVDTTLYDALQKHASDIHLESTGEGLIVKYRLDGVLHKVVGPLEKSYMTSVISRIKVMSELDISERRIPQDGRFRVKFKDKAIDFRVSIMPSIHGEDAVIRILDKEHLTKEFSKLTLESLGISKREIERIRRLIREPYGMILVTGPTGSGKTTTLYGALTEVNTGEDKIITIEDPVEYELKGVVQIPVNEKKGLTFARGLRSILRHDPDKIMVGEIRDTETAQIAIQAALTGHLVFTTVHANNVFDVIGRFIHMGIEPYNFVSSLNCVMAQRLLRLNCVKCRTEVKVSEADLIASNINAAGASGRVFYKGRGCAECHNTGYSGRKAVVELLELSDELKDMIGAKLQLSSVKKKAAEEGMITLRQAAVELFLMGETTLEEINRVTFVE